MSGIRRSAEHQRRVIEARRSNGARPHRLKTAYTRKTKHKRSNPGA